MKQYKRAFIQFINKTLPKLPFLWLPCVVLTAVFLGIFRLVTRSAVRAVRNIRSAFSAQSVFAAPLAAYADDMSDGGYTSGGTVWSGRAADGIASDGGGSGVFAGYLSPGQIKVCHSTGNIRANGYSPGGNTGTDKGSLCPDGIIGEYYARRQHALLLKRCRQ